MTGQRHFLAAGGGGLADAADGVLGVLLVDGADQVGGSRRNWARRSGLIQMRMA